VGIICPSVGETLALGKHQTIYPQVEIRLNYYLPNASLKSHVACPENFLARAGLEAQRFLK